MVLLVAIEMNCCVYFFIFYINFPPKFFCDKHILVSTFDITIQLQNKTILSIKKD